jgi:hypothetical protein
MCIDCEDNNAILPSVESFQQRLKNPKVYYLFYEYFFKAVMGEARWKRNLQEEKRLGTTVGEAFTHALLENNYFAWLFDYKCKKPLMLGGRTSTLTTEYEEPPQNSTKVLFCGDLTGVEIALPQRDGQEYKFLQEESSEDDQYNEARDAATELQDEIVKLARSTAGHKRVFDEVHKTQENFATIGEDGTDKDQKKKKRQCMRDLKVYTGNAAKNTTRRYKGWSDEGKKFLCEMAVKIKKDVESGSHAQWEKIYRSIYEVVRLSQISEEDEIVQPYQIDCNIMYEEVAGVQV